MNPNLAEQFDDLLAQLGGPNFTLMEAALKAFFALPEAIQMNLRKPNITIEEAKRLLIEELLDKEALDFLNSLSSKERQVVNLILKEAKAKFSRKK